MAAFGSGFGAQAANQQNFNPNKDTEVTSPPDDSISSMSFSPTANLLVATSWDNQVSYAACRGRSATLESTACMSCACHATGAQFTSGAHPQQQNHAHLAPALHLTHRNPAGTLLGDRQQRDLRPQGSALARPAGAVLSVERRRNQRLLGWMRQERQDVEPGDKSAAGGEHASLQPPCPAAPTSILHAYQAA